MTSYLLVRIAFWFPDGRALVNEANLYPSDMCRCALGSKYTAGTVYGHACRD